MIVKTVILNELLFFLKKVYNKEDCPFSLAARGLVDIVEAVIARQFAKEADFFRIGTNDLI